jgi:hypothetical protein
MLPQVTFVGIHGRYSPSLHPVNAAADGVASQWPASPPDDRMFPVVRGRRLVRAALAVGIALGGNRPARAAATTLAHWTPLLQVPGIVDVSAPRSDGSLTLTTGARLFLLSPAGVLGAFARGADGYAGVGAEQYIALAQPRRVPGAGCRFGRDDVYALDVASPGVVAVDSAGRARRVAALPAAAFPNGIAFDGVGRFGHRVLVTVGLAGATNVYAIDCLGRVQTVVEGAPRVEGGMVVAPRTFGRWAGQLVAPDEIGGDLVAIDARGRSSTIVASGLAVGQDVGVESLGFVPAGFRRGAAFLADRGVPGNPHPGTDSVLRISGAALAAAQVRVGDLLVATEGGADTIAVRCRAQCSVRRVADGPAATHAEGHLIVVRGR